MHKDYINLEKKPTPYNKLANRQHYSVIQKSFFKTNRAIGGLQLDYYKNTDVDTPYLEFSITAQNGKMLNWILNEWGRIYNSEEEFLIFFNFLTALTNQLHQLYRDN